MTEALQIAQRHRDGIAVIELKGHFVGDDGDTALMDQVASLETQGIHQFLVDLHGVTHMDSGGVGSLVATYLHVVRRQGQLKLLSPSTRVARVLQMTHVGSIFEVFTDETTAIRSFPRPNLTRAPGA